MNIKKKYVLMLVAGVFAFTSVGLGWKYADARLPKNTSESKETLIANHMKITDLYSDSSYTYLNSDISDAMIKDARQSVSEKDEKLLSVAEKKWAIQKALNSLYEKPILVGNETRKNIMKRTTATKEDENKVVVLLSSLDTKDAFSTTVNDILKKRGINTTETSTTDTSEEESNSEEDESTATEESNSEENESTATEKAKAKVDIVVQDDKVVPGFTMEQYMHARDAIADLPEGNTKEELTKKLALVEDAMTGMGIDY